MNHRHDPRFDRRRQVIPATLAEVDAIFGTRALDENRVEIGAAVDRIDFGDWIPVTLPDRFRRLHSSCEIVSRSRLE